MTDIRGGADKYLAQPRRKQGIATRLGTYSIYSPRSSIHFLACCPNFLQEPPTKMRMLSVQPGLHGSGQAKDLSAPPCTVTLSSPNYGQYEAIPAAAFGYSYTYFHVH